MSRGRRILLISPVFHGYWKSIARGFEARGHQVTSHTYDDHDGFVAKVRNKVVYEGLDRLVDGAGTQRQVQAATAGARQALREVQPDALVVVKGDLLDDPFWEDVEKLGIDRVLWLYDEIRRTRHQLTDLARHPVVASYSPSDVQAMRNSGIRAELVHLAFDPAWVGPTRPSDDVVFIGARYEKREALLTAMARLGVPIRAVGRDWSHRTVDRLRTWSWARPDLRAMPSVSREEATGMMAGALATLNIHGDQDGFTMRTFEAAGVGAVQLIDRDDVDEYYEPGVEILPFADASEVAELVARLRVDREWAARIGAAARARTLAEHTFADRAAVLESLWG